MVVMLTAVVVTVNLCVEVKLCVAVTVCVLKTICVPVFPAITRRNTKVRSAPTRKPATPATLGEIIFGCCSLVGGGATGGYVGYVGSCSVIRLPQLSQ